MNKIFFFLNTFKNMQFSNIPSIKKWGEFTQNYESTTGLSVATPNESLRSTVPPIP